MSWFPYGLARTCLAGLRKKSCRGAFSQLWKPLASALKLSATHPCFTLRGGEDFGNYQSFNLNEDAATAELKREREAGYLEWFRTRRQMERKLGKCWPSKVAVLIKYAADGSILKVRLIHDLRRSGVNSKVRVQERLVLPRIGDALTDILELLEAFPGLEIEMETADFKDAFKQMRAGEPERKYLCGKALGGWFCYKTVFVRPGVWPSAVGPYRRSPYEEHYLYGGHEPMSYRVLRGRPPDDSGRGSRGETETNAYDRLLVECSPE